MAEQNPATERPTAPVTPVMQAHNFQIERQGQTSAPYSERFPQVRGGVCEFCGIIDPHTEAKDQYKLCSHYRGAQLRCSYCDESKNPDEVNGKSILNIAKHPDNPNKLVVWCDSYECSKKHLERFRIST